MSDSNSTEDGPRHDGEARLDALLSAERDGALDPAERAELDARLAGDPAAAERRAAFEAVDAALGALGEEPLDEAAIAEGLEALRARTRAGTPDATPGVVQLDARRAPWRHPVVPLLAGAAAAVLILTFAVAPQEPADAPESQTRPQLVEQREAPEGVGLVSDDAEALGFDPELAIALGYGENGDLLPGVDNDDLPVISELDLLDFMAAREEGGRG